MIIEFHVAYDFSNTDLSSLDGQGNAVPQVSVRAHGRKPFLLDFSKRFGDVRRIRNIDDHPSSLLGKVGKGGKLRAVDSLSAARESTSPIPPHHRRRVVGEGDVIRWQSKLLPGPRCSTEARIT